MSNTNNAPAPREGSREEVHTILDGFKKRVEEIQYLNDNNWTHHDNDEIASWLESKITAIVAEARASGYAKGRVETIKDVSDKLAGMAVLGKYSDMSAAEAFSFAAESFKVCSLESKREDA